jgi:predicted alpha/beta hydrolase
MRFLSLLRDIQRSLVRIEALLSPKGFLMAAIDDLTTQVSAQVTVEQSAITLLNGLKAKLDAAIAAQQAGDDSAELKSLSATLGASASGLAAAVVANTPAAPAAPAPSASPAPPADPAATPPTS